MAFKVYLYISLTLCSIKEPDIQTQIRWVFLRCLPSFQSSDFPNKVIFFALTLSAVQLLSCVRLCDPMDGSTPGFPVHHQLPELIQTHVHWVGDAIQPFSSVGKLATRQNGSNSAIYWMNEGMKIFFVRENTWEVSFMVDRWFVESQYLGNSQNELKNGVVDLCEVICLIAYFRMELRAKDSDWYRDTPVFMPGETAYGLNFSVNWNLLLFHVV